MALPGIRASLAVLMAMWGCGCMGEQAADPATARATTPAPFVSQDRLPAMPATRASTRNDGSGDHSCWECEGRRQMICQQQWVGAQEKCQRMTCELVA